MNTVLLIATLGVAAAGLALLLAFGAASSYTNPRRLRALRTPADVELEYESVLLRCSDGVIAPAWYVPRPGGAVIILLHGLGANREFMLDRARVLAEYGYGTLMLDLRAHGESVGGRCSIGLREVAEVQAAVEFLTRHPVHPSRRIGILGESLGGSVALLAAGVIPEIDAVVVDSTFGDLADVITEKFSAFINLPLWMRPLVIALGERQAGVCAREVRPLDGAARLGNRPLLVIHGSEDQLFPPHHAERLYAAASGPRELWLVPGAGHAESSSKYPREYEARVMRFFQRWVMDPTAEGGAGDLGAGEADAGTGGREDAGKIPLSPSERAGGEGNPGPADTGAATSGRPEVGGSACA